MSDVLRTTALRPDWAGESRAGAVGAGRPWPPAFRAAHATSTTILLLALVVVFLLGFRLPTDTGAALLLIGGALIGVPHGTSDFVVAHRLFRPRLGWGWLPVFVLGYGALVGLVMLGWAVAPTAVLTGFLVVSGLHFGKEDRDAGGLPATGLRVLAHATTPLVPIVLLHLPEVVPFFAVMGGRNPDSVTAALLPMRIPLLALWAATVFATMLPALMRTGHAVDPAATEARDLLVLSLAAVVLPPLVAFAVYFCLIHAVRHMVQLTAGTHPRNGRRALALAGWVALPSAALCGIGLAFAWSALAGTMPTDTLLCAALRLVAALTVPHMLLELIAERAPDGAGS